MRVRVDARLAVCSIILILLIAPGIRFEGVLAIKSNGRIIYFYNVDVDGNTSITISVLYTGLVQGTSWVVVPNYLNWSYMVSDGSLTYSEVKKIVRNGFEDPFWENFTFSFSSPSRFFNLTISYTVPLYTFILEPNGLFYSSQIEYKGDLDGIAEILLPINSTASMSDVGIITSSGIKTPSNLLVIRSPNKRVLISCSTETNSRIIVAFKSKNIPVYENYTLGVFTFYTAPRYATYARRFLDLYNRSLPIFLDVFNITVTSINVTFFLPSQTELLSGLGGYVPFRGGRPGDIHLNIFYLRTLSGFLEIIALHELTHQMVWYAGIGPKRLWVHEGMAEYFSTEIGKIVGYEEAAEAHRRDLEKVLSSIGEKYGFVQSWSMGSNPSNIVAYYAASYKIFKTLGDKYGGLEYYKRFFRIIKSMRSKDDDSSIITALGLAAGNVTEVLLTFKRWGFSGISKIEDIVLVLEEAKRAVNGISVFLQPFKLISEALLSIALEAYNKGQYSIALMYVNGVMFIVENLLLLSILTYTALVLLTFKLMRRVKLKPVKPKVLFCPSCGSRIPEEALYCPYCGRYLRDLRR